MKAMIMAAGLGTRLLPLTRLTSKPMVPVLNQPVMQHIVALLQRHGITEMAANLHYQPDEIPAYFDDGSAFGVSLRYQFESTLSGTAGGTGLFREFLSDDAFLVVSGDALTDVNISELVASHRAAGAMATMACKPVADTSHYGVVVADERGRVTGFQEKPPAGEARSNLCNCGIYVFEPQIFDYIPTGRFVDYALNVLPALLADGVPLHAWRLESYWSDVGSLDAYRSANYDALAGLVNVSPVGAEIRPGVWVGEGAQVAPSARLSPPLLLGAGCRVGDGAEVMGPSALGEQCVVGTDAVVQGAVMWSRCSIGSGAMVDGALLGEGVQVGDGACVGHGAVVANGCQVCAGAQVPAEDQLEPGTVVASDGAAC